MVNEGFRGRLIGNFVVLIVFIISITFARLDSMLNRSSVSRFVGPVVRARVVPPVGLKSPGSVGPTRVSVFKAKSIVSTLLSCFFS